MSDTVKQWKRWICAAFFLCLPVFAARGETNHYVRRACTNPVPPYASWATAATNIPDAVAVAVDGDTVWVTNGTYGVTDQITITNGVTLRSVRGNGVTTLELAGSNTVSRVLAIRHPGAAVSGFTIQNGMSFGNGGGVLLTAGILSNCVVSGNKSVLLGGGVYCETSGRVVNCSISGNVGSGGGGLYLYGGLAQHCDVSANWAAGIGGGAVCTGGGVLRNSSIHGNGYLWGVLPVTPMGGGVYCMDTGLVENCTIAGNAALLDGGGLACLGNNGVVRNSIIYLNNAGRNDPNCSISAGGWFFERCCADPLPAGTNNTDADPQFTDSDSILVAPDFSLLPGSPCIDSGTNQVWMTGARDMADASRIMNTNVDMGAHEFDPRPFNCNFTADRREGAAPLKVVFRAIRSGASTTILNGILPGVTWRFTRTHFPWTATTLAGGSAYLVVTNTFTDADTYTVSLTIRHSVSEFPTVQKAGYIRVGSASAYVAPGGGNEYPYTTWAKAATSIQDAVDAVVDGGTVFVTNGTYSTKVQIVISNLVFESSTPIKIQKPVVVRSMGGAEQTVFDGGAGSRCFWIGHTGAVVQGFTVQGGTGDQGAGIYALAGRVQDCIVRHNAATMGGGGLYCGPQASAVNCLFYGNSTALYGGGVWNEGALINCTVASNLAVIGGGGVYNAVASSSLTNTIIHGNNAATGSQYYGEAVFSHCCASPVASGESNIDVNPLFVFPDAGVYRIAGNSPCRDVGLNQAWMTNGLDLAGNARRYDNGVVDLGAYEWEPPPPLLLIYRADPSTGDILYRYGTNLTCSAAGVIAKSDAIYSNRGWSVTGNVSSNGMGTNVTLALQDDAVLRWAWSNQFFFTAVSSDTNLGVLAGDTNGWYDEDAVLHVTGVPTNFYHVGLWWGYGGDGNDLVLTNTQPRNLIAFFVLNVTSNGTPEPWLVSYGLTNPSLQEADQADGDHDGAPAWAEYSAGTDPTNPASCFAIRSITPTGAGNLLQWTSVSGRVYRVFGSTNLDTVYSLGPLGGVQATPPTNAWTDTSASSNALYFYRIMTH